MQANGTSLVDSQHWQITFIKSVFLSRMNRFGISRAINSPALYSIKRGYLNLERSPSSTRGSPHTSTCILIGKLAFMIMPGGQFFLRAHNIPKKKPSVSLYSLLIFPQWAIHTQNQSPQLAEFSRLWKSDIASLQFQLFTK